MTREAMRMKATPKTRVREKKRALMVAIMPALGLGLTFQMVFMESWSSPKTPEAEKRRMTVEMMVAMTPEPGWPAWTMSSWTAAAPLAPMAPWRYVWIWPSAAFWLNSLPTILIAMTSRGAIESMV